MVDVASDAAPSPAVPGSGGEPSPAARIARRNRWAFAVGTLGRDMVYALVSLYLVYYLTDVLDVPDATMWWVTGVLLGIRVLDALLDPVMGAVVDSTRSRWGQFRPWLVVGGLGSAALTTLLFVDTGLTGTSFVVVFALINLAWGVSWAAHDIAYWGMLPALSLEPTERERLGSLAKVFASVGLFAVTAGLVPLTAGLAGAVGGETAAWLVVAALIATVMLVGLAVTVLVVREPTGLDLTGERTGIRDLVRAIARNDQLLWVALAFLLFMIGYGTTGAFGLYFFEYAYGDKSVFPLFALFVGVGQLAGFALFPWLARRWSRPVLYRGAMMAVVAAYLLFFLAPMNLLALGPAAFVLFFAAALIIVLMIAFMADTVEYGQWKLGQRNGAVTFALQPFINKVSGATSTAVVSATVILAGINEAESAAEVSAGGLLMLKVAMLFAPAALVVLGYVVWRWRWRLDDATHARIVADLAERGDLGSRPSAG
ncbi:MAG: glycoside-pentoside-hexuronide (GPH):cation symporter [Dermatophilaceae bacterium]